MRTHDFNILAVDTVHGHVFLIYTKSVGCVPIDHTLVLGNITYLLRLAF